MSRPETTKSTVISKLSGKMWYMTLVKIPPPIIWKSRDINWKFKPNDEGCSYQPFFLSTGTTVTEGVINFSNIWFPFYRISHTDWLHKASDLGNTAGRVYLTLKRLNDEENWGITHQTIKSFLLRFDFFWQIKISARMDIPNEELDKRGCAWDQMLKLKEFVLTHNYDEKSKSFVPEEGSEVLIPSLPSSIVNGKEKINEWLKSNHAMCVEEKTEVDDNDAANM